ncbi:uncharacterized protein WM277_026508 isoform 2-T3 [Molossus nigricans]
MASFREEPKPGDLIQISRSGYSHWAISVGDGYVIHLAPLGANPAAGSSSRGVVSRELLEDVAGDCSYQVKNHLDHLYKPWPVLKMISSAKEMVGKEMEYQLLSRNCEQFLTDLRYGQARSRQFVEEPKPGDLVEISRVVYKDWAIYVGDGYAIHLAPLGECPGADPSSRGEVKRELLTEVAGDCPFKVQNRLDHQYKPQAVSEMISSAEELIGKEMDYSVLSSNREHFVTNLRYGQAGSRQLVEEPRAGDIIQISRSGYSHWAIYVGGGRVIHLAPLDESPEVGSSPQKGEVKRELLAELAGDCPYQVNNHLDHLYEPRPVKEMIRSAEELIGKKMDCSVLSSNREHFVIDLRYGQARSRQCVREPMPGDMIEIPHTVYKDWAIYVGDGCVIHLTPPSEWHLSMFLSGNATVTKQSLEKVALGCSYQVNNHLDHKYRPRPVHEIIRSAEEVTGVQKTYTVLRDNSEKFVTDLRYGWFHRELSREVPIPGDLIAISRGRFKHWAIYVGDGCVVHVTAPDGYHVSGSANSCEQTTVKCEPLNEVAGNDRYCVSNFLDHKYRPRPVPDIVRLAKMTVGETWKYNLVSSNCEHFVTKLRNGLPCSAQSKLGVRAILAASVSVPVIIATL